MMSTPAAGGALKRFYHLVEGIVTWVSLTMPSMRCHTWGGGGADAPIVTHWALWRGFVCTLLCNCLRPSIFSASGAMPNATFTCLVQEPNFVSADAALALIGGKILEREGLKREMKTVLYLRS